VVEEIDIFATHSRYRWTTVAPIENGAMVAEASIEWLWLDAQKLSNIGDHTTLLVEHRVWDSVIYQALEHRSVEIIRLDLQSWDATVSLELLVITN